MIRFSFGSSRLVSFAGFAFVLAACAEADSLPSRHDGGGDSIVLPELDTGRPASDTGLPVIDTGLPVVDTGDKPKDTGTPGTDTSTCTVPSGKACGTIPQCGCAGQNCDITVEDGTRACVAAGPSSLHDNCSAIGDCAAGLSCIAGNCLPFCNTATDCSSGSCVNITDSTGSNIPGYKVCFEDCDPANPSAGCGAGNCTFNGTAGTVCTGTGSGTSVGGCSDASPFSCAAGYACLTSGECAKWCRVGFPSDCSGGLTCMSFTDPPTLGGVEYGVCN